MASDNKLWTPMSGDDIKDWRRDLPKGSIRESNTAHTVGYDEIESDGDTVAVAAPASPSIPSVSDIAPPREVAQEIYGLVWEWAKGSRENFQLMATIVRNNNPDAYGHLSDDELAEKIEQHARDAARSATEDVYADGWDRGNDIDMWQGKPVKP